ncbi:MAG: IclR family transcriptional regulator [Anaerolineaceae bacterium]|nr:IclR family transcriptional regulator [Anaerolineaceae bacterium]
MQTLNRAIQILDCYTLDRYELGVREIARLTGLSTSVCGRLMAALKDEGILNQNEVSKTYSIGPKPLRWAEIYSTNLDIRNVALPIINELLVKTQETVSLYILDGSERLCIERMESAQNVRIVARIGRRLPLYAGSAGKVLLAFLPFHRQEEIIKATNFTPFTDSTITNPDQLRQELRKIRQQGFAFSDGEWVADAAGIAAPIFDHKNDVIAALTVSGPSSRFSPTSIQTYKEAILRGAEKISFELGYVGNIYFQQKH